MSEETIEAKAQWFQSLSPEERLKVFCSFTNFLLKINPDIVKIKDALSTSERIRIITKASS